MLIQLHAQNPSNANQTEFLMQGEVGSDAEVKEWLALCSVKWDELKELRPEGWVPMVCTETHEAFLRALR